MKAGRNCAQQERGSSLVPHLFHTVPYSNTTTMSQHARAHARTHHLLRIHLFSNRCSNFDSRNIEHTGILTANFYCQGDSDVKRIVTEQFRKVILNLWVTTQNRLTKDIPLYFGHFIKKVIIYKQTQTKRGKNLFPCLIHHHVMEAYAGKEVGLHVF